MGGAGDAMKGASLQRSVGDRSVEPWEPAVTMRGGRRAGVSAAVGRRRSDSQRDERTDGGGEVGAVIRPDGSDDGLAQAACLPPHDVAT